MTGGRIPFQSLAASTSNSCLQGRVYRTFTPAAWQWWHCGITRQPEIKKSGTAGNYYYAGTVVSSLNCVQRSSMGFTSTSPFTSMPDQTSKGSALSAHTTVPTGSYRQQDELYFDGSTASNILVEGGTVKLKILCTCALSNGQGTCMVL